MKRFLLFSLIMLCMQIPLASNAREFYYTYDGDELLYAVLDEEAKTCEVRRCSTNDGVVRIPSVAKDGENEYSVTTIGEEAFSSCHSLVSVNIPASVTTIGERAFSYCKSLVSANIPASVTTIGEEAFYNCSSLVSANIPASVTTIGERTFYYCSSLVSANIPSSVTTIGEGAFYHCSSLVSANIPASVTTIGEGAFSSCSSLASVNIPASVTTIGKNAFTGCSSLTRVSIPQSVETVGVKAFSSCEKLKEINIEDSEKELTFGNDDFNGCPIESVYLGRNISFNIYSPFYEKPLLKSLVISNTVTAIGDDAFWRCRKISRIDSFNPVPPQILWTTFDAEIREFAELHVLKGTKDAYMANSEWSKFKTIIDDLEDKTSGIEYLREAPHSQDAIEFYNLNGVKVNRDKSGLTPGIYIMRQGNRTSKIAVH